MATEHVVHLRNPGPRPAFYLVAHHLWGASCNIDSDGNSSTPEDDNWTELSLFLREASPSEQIHVDPVSDDPLVLAIRSPSAALCERVAAYLARTTGGTIEHAI
jgi:hypothetical protein